MTQLHQLMCCPFCDPPKYSRRLTRHIHWHHKEEIENGRMKLTVDGRLFWNGSVKMKVLGKELDSMPKVMIEVRPTGHQ